MFGALTGLADRIVALFRDVSGALSSTPRRRFFSEGFGTIADADENMSRCLDWLAAANSESPEPTKEVNVSLELDGSDDDVRKGRFTSPLARTLPQQAGCLPDEVGQAEFLFVGHPVQEGSAPSVTLMWFPATGEEDNAVRLLIAKSLFKVRGWCSVILTAPFYGSRRQIRQTDHHCLTVEDYLNQSTALIWEALLLARWVRQEMSNPNNESIICFTGYSWGGAMAAVTSLSSLHCLPGDVKVVAAPYAGSATPAVLIDGVLKGDVDWQALMMCDGTQSLEKTESRVLNILLSQHIREFFLQLAAARVRKGLGETGEFQAARKLSAVECVSFKHDHFVPLEWGTDLFEFLRPWCPENSRLTMHAGGHVVAYLKRSTLQRDAVERVVDAVKDDEEEITTSSSGSFFCDLDR